MPESLKLILEIIGAIVTITGLFGALWTVKRKADFDIVQTRADNYKALYESEKEKNTLLVECKEQTALLLDGQEELKSQNLELLSKL